MNRLPLLCSVLFGAAVVAQDKVDLKIEDGKQPLRYTIESSSKSTTETARTLDGEPMQGRGGPSGPVNLTRTTRVIFDEGRGEAGTWREYSTATATTEVPDETGGIDKREIEGGLVGKRLEMIEDDRGLVITADGEALPRFSAIGIPGRTSFAGVTPGEAVAIGAEFELGGAFLASLKALNHPVTPALTGGRGARPGAGAEGGQDGATPPQGGRRRPGQGAGQGGDGAQGGDQPQPPRGQGRGQRGQGGDGAQGGAQPPRGQRGQGGFQGGAGGMAGMFGGGGVSPTALLGNDRLEGAVMAKLEKLDGNIAKLSVTGTRSGEGSLEELGLSAASRFGGGRGGRGGQGGGNFPTPEGDGAAEVTLQGELWIDVTSHQLVKLVITGKATQHTMLEIDMGERGLMGTETSGEDVYRFALQAAPAPAKKAVKKDSKDGDR